MAGVQFDTYDHDSRLNAVKRLMSNQFEAVNTTFELSAFDRPLGFKMEDVYVFRGTPSE